MSFWSSEFGQLTGDASDAFAKTFKNIPNDTMAIAKIESMGYKEYNGDKYIQIDWQLVGGDFGGQHVFHKLYVFDKDAKRKHRFLNMLVLLYKLFEMQPESDMAPTDAELLKFKGKHAGIKIQETEPNEHGKVYNWVSEVYPAVDFIPVTGKSPEPKGGVESAFSRNPRVALDELESDLPF